MVDRQIDWRAFLNKLIYCHGCGRFGMPRQGKRPRGWSVLYQPHPQGPPGLNVCSDKCKAEVQEALVKGPVTGPLRMGSNVTMSTEMRETMMTEAMQFAIDEGHADDLFLAAMKDEGERDD